METVRWCKASQRSVNECGCRESGCDGCREGAVRDTWVKKQMRDDEDISLCGWTPYIPFVQTCQTISDHARRSYFALVKALELESDLTIHLTHSQPSPTL